MKVKDKLLIVCIAIAMFPGFVSGIHYLKRDITFLYCSMIVCMEEKK
jgi:hypothetical protein